MVSVTYLRSQSCAVQVNLRGKDIRTFLVPRAGALVLTGAVSVACGCLATPCAPVLSPSSCYRLPDLMSHSASSAESATVSTGSMDYCRGQKASWFRSYTLPIACTAIAERNRSTPFRVHWEPCRHSSPKMWRYCSMWRTAPLQAANNKPDLNPCVLYKHAVNSTNSDPKASSRTNSSSISETGFIMGSSKNWKLMHRRTIPGPPGDPAPIIRRWTLLETPLFGIKIHHILRSDPLKRGFHDHPWSFVSLCLGSRYIDNILGPEGRIRQKTKRLVFHKSTTPHRIELPSGAKCWTIFITGPRRNDWKIIPPEEAGV